MNRWIIWICLLLSPGVAQTSLSSLRQASQDGLYTSVVTLAPDFLSQEPNNAEAHFLLALALYHTGDLPRARLEFDQSQVLDFGETAEVLHLSGLLNAAEGNVSGSLENLRRAFEQSQSYPIAMDWGNVAWESGMYQEALEAFERAATTPLGQTQMWPELNRARILHLALNDYETAILAYETAIEIFIANDPGGQASPGYVEAFFRLGQVYEALEDSETAKSNYQAAINSDPNYEPAIAALKRLGQ